MEAEQKICVEIRLLYNAIRHTRAQQLSNLSTENAMTFMHSRTIVFLYENLGHAIFQRDIEHEYDISRPTATRILQSMEKDGLITRHGVDFDARLKQVELTDKAIKLHEELTDITNEFEESLVKGITAEEIEIFFKVIDRIKGNLGME